MVESNDILVEVSGVSKKFSRNLKLSLRYGLIDFLKSFFVRSPKSPTLRKSEFWAVRDISFQLKRGECLGLIGHNGAGKSTLLKMLNGLIPPSQGEIRMKGKIGALIELGAGFNPILTGRENIYTNGQILGFTKKEIDQKLEAIIEFSELGDFIDTPLQNYSSGMKVRLGFAVAAQMEPDVLIIDEVLAVGDLGFILKCFNVIDRILPNTAVIFVSHNMPLVSRICTKILLMDKGGSEFIGNNVAEGIDKYYSKFSIKSNAVFSLPEKIVFDELKVTDSSNNPIDKLNWGEDIKFQVKFNLHKSISKPLCNIIISDKEKRPVGICFNSNREYIVDQSGTSEMIEHKTNLTLQNVQLSKGIYSVTFVLMENEGSKPLLRVQDAASFQVIDVKDVWPPYRFDGTWLN